MLWTKGAPIYLRTVWRKTGRFSWGKRRCKSPCEADTSRVLPCAGGIIARAAGGYGAAPCGHIGVMLRPGAGIGGLCACTFLPLARITRIPFAHAGAFVQVKLADNCLVPRPCRRRAHGRIIGIIRKGRNRRKQAQNNCTNQRFNMERHKLSLPIALLPPIALRRPFRKPDATKRYSDRRIGRAFYSTR